MDEGRKDPHDTALPANHRVAVPQFPVGLLAHVLWHVRGRRGANDRLHGIDGRVTAPTATPQERIPGPALALTIPSKAPRRWRTAQRCSHRAILPRWHEHCRYCTLAPPFRYLRHPS